MNPDAYVEPGYPKGVMPSTFSSLPAAADRRARQVPAGRRQVSDAVIGFHEHEAQAEHPPPAAPPRGFHRLARAGLAARAVDDPALLRDRRRDHGARPRARELASDLARLDHHDGRADHRAARVPRRPRRLRLLDALRDRRADPARGPLGPRRPQLARLLPDQHRPQGDRDPVPGDDHRLLRDRRPAGDVHARRAGAAGDAVRRQPDLQRPLLGARGADDLPVRDPGLRRDRQLRDPADARARRTWPSRA